MQTYSFRSHNFDEEDSTNPLSATLSKDIVVTPAASWMMILAEFLEFLGAVYGYDLKERVFVEDYDVKKGLVDYMSVRAARIEDVLRAA